MNVIDMIMMLQHVIEAKRNVVDLAYLIVALMIAVMLDYQDVILNMIAKMIVVEAMRIEQRVVQEDINAADMDINIVLAQREKQQPLQLNALKQQQPQQLDVLKQQQPQLNALKQQQPQQQDSLKQQQQQQLQRQ